MRIPKCFLIIFLLLLVCSNEIIAQYGFSHEVGIITGPVAFQSDYGERHDFSTNAGNTGYGIGIIHYLNFSYKADCNCYTPETYFNDHFKLRSELSYNKTELKHFGEWVRPERKKLFNEQLRGMRGSTAITNIGMQLEFLPMSTLGKLNTPATTPIKYYNATDNAGGTVWSIVSSVGSRYKISPLSDLMVDLRFQYYFSNWVDGLNPDPKIYTENRSNDWLVWFNFGYIYYIQ